MSSEEARERAAAGASLLDRKYPGWWEKVELQYLDMGSAYNCTLGQLYGEYGSGLEELGLSTGRSEPQLYGFDEGWDPDTETYIDYEELDEAWIYEIEDRYF